MRGVSIGNYRDEKQDSVKNIEEWEHPSGFTTFVDRWKSTVEYDSHPQKYENKELLEPDASHVDVNAFTTAVSVSEKQRMSRKRCYMLGVLLTKKDSFTGYILTGGDTGAPDLNEKCSRIDRRQNLRVVWEIKRKSMTHTISSKTKYRVNLQALIPASLELEVKLYTIRPMTM